MRSPRGGACFFAAFLLFCAKTHAAESMGILPFPWRARRRAKIRSLRHLASSQPCPRQREPLITRAGGSKNIANMALPAPFRALLRQSGARRKCLAKFWILASPLWQFILVRSLPGSTQNCPLKRLLSWIFISIYKIQWIYSLSLYLPHSFLSFFLIL